MIFHLCNLDRVNFGLFGAKNYAFMGNFGVFKGNSFMKSFGVFMKCCFDLLLQSLKPLLLKLEGLGCKNEMEEHYNHFQHNSMVH